MFKISRIYIRCDSCNCTYTYSDDNFNNYFCDTCKKDVEPLHPIVYDQFVFYSKNCQMQFNRQDDHVESSIWINDKLTSFRYEVTLQDLEEIVLFL